MAARAAAAALLLASIGVAWLASLSWWVALPVQLAVVASVSYVAYLAWRGWRTMRDAIRSAPAGDRLVDRQGAGATRPFVTLVVPARDEAPVIEAITRDLATQLYHAAGRPRFEVVVVDDGSTDGTGQIARRVAEDYGERVRVARREPGSGPATRGAALQHATPFARGEVIVAIDADSRVGPDFLARAMAAWERDPDAVGLQALRRPTNRHASWLTAAQAEEHLIDMASQCGRWSVGGTTELHGNGMFVRRAVLERIGGWGERALTEDLDISSRLVAAGERVTVAPEASVGEEAVQSVSSLWPQRLRWAEGSLRRLVAHGPAVLRAPIPLGRKLDFVSFLAEFIVPPLTLASIAFALLALLTGGDAAWSLPLLLVVGYWIGTFALALAGLAAEGRRGLALVGGGLRGSLFLAHWLAVVPFALGRIVFGPADPAYVKTPRAGHRAGAPR